MATHHDSPDNGGGFWGCANLGFGIGFAFCALLAGGGLFLGGFTRGSGKLPEPPAPAAAPAAPAAPKALEVTLRPGSANNGLSFDTTTITAKAGQKIKLTFVNQHPIMVTPHNVVICKIGSKDKIVALANGMVMDFAKATAAGFIPDSPDVIAHTKLVDPGKSETIEFTLPEKGEYPFLCTYVGHSLLMQGTVVVE